MYPMRRFLPIVVLLIVAVIMTCCNPAAKTIQPTATISATAVPLPLPNVTCNELSFYPDPTLGTHFTCETVPEVSTSDIPVNYPFIYPTHTVLTIQDYPLTGTQFLPSIWIYPLSRYSELLPDIIPPCLSELQSIISGNPLAGKEMPFLPPIPQIQSFYLHEALLSFQGGEGVRYITVYSDGPHLITNKNILYTFQGLTDDGKYWVAVTLPISSPVLPADYDIFPKGYTQESLIANYKAYVSDVERQLKSQLPDSFFPTMDSLDELIKSVIVK